MPTIGQDCDLILVHPDVNSGDPYGFSQRYARADRGDPRNEFASGKHR
jgi:hypothetical protein